MFYYVLIILFTYILFLAICVHSIYIYSILIVFVLFYFECYFSLLYYFIICIIFLEYYFRHLVCSILYTWYVVYYIPGV